MPITKYHEMLSHEPQKIRNYMVGTGKAAQILGLSITSVKNLVDKQELIYWKTQGGHRRIDMESIRKYQNKLKKPIESNFKSKPLPSISFMVEDTLMVNRLKNMTTPWQDMIEFNIQGSIFETYLCISQKTPDILIVHAKMPVAQQITTVFELQNFIESSEKYTSVIFLTHVTDLSMRLEQELNPAIQISNDTLSHEWLRAFITGVMASPEWRIQKKNNVREF